MVAVLEARDLRLRYWNGIEALRGLSLELHEGELLAVIGPNGAGKSSLLRALAGLTILCGGDVRVRDISFLELPMRERARYLSLVQQEPRVPSGLPVRELVLMARYPHLPFLAGPGRADREIVESCLDALGCGALRERLFGELSGGEKQRVLFARCLAQATPVILLDEPTSSLDPGHKLAILERIRDLLEDGERSVLLVTHDLNLASQFADRVLLMRGGRVTASGRPNEVLCQEFLEPAYGDAFVYGRLASPATGDERPWVLPWLKARRQNGGTPKQAQEPGT